MKYFRVRCKYFPAINHSLLRSYNVTGAPLSYIVENDVTVSALTEVIRHCSNVEVKYNTKVKRWVHPGNSMNKMLIIINNSTIYDIILDTLFPPWVTRT